MNFQKLLFICGLEQSRRDLLQMILPIGEKNIFMRYCLYFAIQQSISA